jgi:hypothetical protein
LAEAPDSARSDGGGLEAARFRMRTAGYCVLCDRIVEHRADGGCGADAAHPAAALSGRVPLGPEDPLPCLPRFNLAAFLVPPVWGPANHQWVGAVFLPMWLFADSMVASAVERGPVLNAAALLVVVGTIGAQAWFAKRANGLAWRRVADRVSVEEFARRQRMWAVASVPLFLVIVGWAAYYRVVLAG